MDKVTQVIELLDQAKTAHGEYESTVLNGVYDQEWPRWYADWIIEHGLNELLGSQFDGETLSKRLKELNEAHQGTDKQLNWSQYAAQRLVEG